MFLSARLRSSITLGIVAVLVGTVAGPLTLCEAERGRVHCPATVSPDVAPHHACDDPEAASTALSCCRDNDASVPLIPATTSDGASAAASSVASVVDDVVLNRALRPVTESTGLPAHHRPLFTLFSTFLI